MQTKLIADTPTPINREFNIAECGTFKDSLKAPIHRWFTYPAGFSYKAVEYSFKQLNLGSGSSIYDPFMGSGTTNIVAKSMGINSYGVEAHPFVFPITKCKLNWDVDLSLVNSELSHIQDVVLSKVLKTKEEDMELQNQLEFPDLVLRCYLPKTLFELLTIRNEIKNINNEDVQLFLNVALICCLREVSIAATGWPYIAPKKIKITSLSKDGIGTFFKRVGLMCDDIQLARNTMCQDSDHVIFLGDSRDTGHMIPSNIVDHIFTSPPYLNNFDYADRTRLEMYFMGDATSWSDICKSVRTKLITSATTQINRHDDKYHFSNEFISTCPKEYEFLSESIEKLSALRLTKGGKKSYDYLVLGYFNDMYQVLKDNYRVLKEGGVATYILGDSAPYGVHIPTDELIGKIAVDVGFSNYEIHVIRERGGKWKNNPQRHSVELRESIVTMRK